METLKFFVHAGYLYMLAGAVFALFFVWRGAAHLDEAARGISWKTRMLLYPAGAALWPLLLYKWYKVRQDLS